MTVTEKIRAIRAIPLFSKLDDGQVEALAKAATIETIPKGGLYFSEQNSSLGFHILVSGRVKLFKMADDGKEQTIFLFGPGEPFCLCSMFSDGKLPASLAALEESRVLVISPDHFEQLSAQDPSLLLTIMRVLSYRLKQAMDMIDALSLKPVPSRLAAYFLTHVQDGRVHLGITQREFAKVIGVTPEALSRALKRMAEAGLIRQQSDHIELADVDGLLECRESGCTI
ncbi:MAG: Crp/Fnr family transcriptional regulator [Desulfovibrio sp.]|uniref:Crp/Fnr family transcriptional regulator n=1 Tax=Desulfovibrio sp. 7SRBS1 TaxID=3378064 RepID=UPI003B3C1AB1